MRLPKSVALLALLSPSPKYHPSTKDKVEIHAIADILDSNNHLHTYDEDTDEQESTFSLFWKMFEWMEIEGAILKSYDEVVGPSLARKKVFRAQELQTLERTFEEVDRVVHSLMAKFFKEFNFACGVLNSILVTYVFAAYPQHFWLLYLIEGLYLLPRNLYERIKAKPLNRVLSYLDYCWMMNTFALLSLISLVLHSVADMPFPKAARKQLFVTTMGTACGTLMGAALVLPFVALLFHDIDTMTGLFIHIFPPMVAYTLRWHSEKVHNAWPNIFNLDYLETVQFFNFGPTLGTVAGNAMAGYIIWFIPYTIWMLLTGLNLPRKDRINPDGSVIIPRFDTCFHIAMRGGGCLAIGKKFWGRSKAKSIEQMKSNHFEAKDLLVYMAVHATMSMFAILVLGYLCYSSQSIHGCFLALVAVISAHRGAKRYTYYTTEMYSRMLRMSLLSQVQWRATNNHKHSFKPN